MPPSPAPNQANEDANDGIERAPEPFDAIRLEGDVVVEKADERLARQRHRLIALRRRAGNCRRLPKRHAAPRSRRRGQLLDDATAVVAGRGIDHDQFGRQHVLFAERGQHFL